MDSKVKPTSKTKTNDPRASILKRTPSGNFRRVALSSIDIRDILKSSESLPLNDDIAAARKASTTLVSLRN